VDTEDLSLYDIPARNPSAPTVIHPTAIIERGARLGQGVVVGPYAIVGPKVVLGDQVQIGAHVVVEGRTTVGARTVVHPFAALGTMPQDLKYKGEDAELVIGEENSIRQYVNMAIGTEGGGGKTVVGRRNLMMVNCHVAHDCVLGDNIVMANGVTLAGHVHVATKAFLGGLCAVHQFCKIGELTMTAGGSMVTQDVPPYCMVQGDRARVNGLNIVGLRRAGMTADVVRDVKTMYRLVYSDNLTLEDAIAKIEAEIADGAEKRLFVGFLRASERGLCR
jgi:UDP-N-acetylglucosamine acyltransferase